MEVPGRSQLELPKLNGVLARIFSPISDVETSFRLLNPSDQQTEDGIFEFFGHDRDIHVVMFNADGNIGRDHRALTERGLKTFSDISMTETTLLVVPEGARSLRHILRLVARDIASYGVIFEEVGQSVQQLERAQLGQPTHGSMLDRFAWAPDENSASGGSISIVPPYGLDHGSTADTIVSNIQGELAASDLFDEGEQASLMGMIENGRQRIG